MKLFVDLQNCIESTFKGISFVIIFHDEVIVMKPQLAVRETKSSYSKVDCVKKTSSPVKRNPTRNESDASLFCLSLSLSIEGIPSYSKQSK